MTILQMFQLVNQCETIEALQEAILKIGDLHPQGMIQGRKEQRNAQEMAEMVPLVVKMGMGAVNLTRNYGIRQQALYLNYCLKREKALKPLG